MIPPPPPLSALRAGTRLVAGMEYSTVIPDLDFETYSEAGYVWDGNGWQKGKKGLAVVGAARYAEHPSTEVLCMAYDLKDGAGRRQWLPGQPFPQDLAAHVAEGGLIEAWNVSFERLIWENVCVPRMGWPVMRREQWRCAMAKARAHALPGALNDAGTVLGTTERKDAAGKRLLNRFSVPRSPTKTDARLRISPTDDPEGPLLYAYNLQDIAVEAEISSRVPDLPPDELEYWQVDQEINARGVQIDTASVRACMTAIEAELAKNNAELSVITGGEVRAASEVARLTKWLQSQDVPIYSLAQEDVEATLARSDLPPKARRALEIRAAVGSASVKKVFAMDARVCADGRLRGLFNYHATRTGRATGDAVQPTNLPRGEIKVKQCAGCEQFYGPSKPGCPWCGGSEPIEGAEWCAEAVDNALEAIRVGAGEIYFDGIMPTISACLRGMFIAAPGHDLICSDYSAIEAVVLAELAGETWRQDVFRTHGKIYEMSASKISGVPFEEILDYKKRTGQHHPLRKTLGKVAELACFSPDTQVLTKRGYVPIVSVTKDDVLWDGVEWVTHQGVIAKGNREVIALDGVKMTPTHPIFINGSWKAASELASDVNMLSQALATGSENLPCRKCGAAIKADFNQSPPFVRAELSLKSNTLLTCETARRLGVMSAPKRNRRKPGTKNAGIDMRLFCQTQNTAADCSTGWEPPSHVALAQTTECTRVTAGEASEYANCGNKTAPLSSCIVCSCQDGTTPALTWTEPMLTGIMNPETSGLFHEPSTRSTSGASTTCNDESTNWSDVYDIAHAGPRNRFTIKTANGHLLVHNSGYQGWIGAWKAFGADAFMSEDEIKQAILSWREASPAIVALWGGVEWAAISAVMYPGQDFTYRGLTFTKRGDALYCRLLSGRYLTYHSPQLTPSDRRQGEWSLSYKGWNTNPKNGPMGWIRMGTWGGRLVENITQATARDIQRFSLVNQEKAGYRIVLHVYDENVAEVPEGWGSVEEFESIMSRVPEWAAGWPVKASGGWRGKRYRK